MEVGARPPSDFTVDLDQTLDGGHKAMGGSHLASQDTQTAFSFSRQTHRQHLASQDTQTTCEDLHS